MRVEPRNFTRLLYLLAQGAVFCYGVRMNKNLFKRRNFLLRTFTFSGYATVAEFWSEIPMKLISFFCAAIVLCIVVSVAVPAETQQIINLVHMLIPILGVIWMIPVAALSRRRLRDAGLSAKTYFWLLLPVIGWIVFIIKLCARSAPRKTGEIWFEYD